MLLPLSDEFSCLLLSPRSSERSTRFDLSLFERTTRSLLSEVPTRAEKARSPRFTDSSGPSRSRRSPRRSPTVTLFLSTSTLLTLLSPSCTSTRTERPSSSDEAVSMLSKCMINFTQHLTSPQKLKNE